MLVLRASAGGSVVFRVLPTRSTCSLRRDKRRDTDLVLIASACVGGLLRVGGGVLCGL